MAQSVGAASSKSLPITAKHAPALANTYHRRGPWHSFEAIEFATLEWVDWFNRRRLLEPIGNIPPAEAETAYYAQLEVMPIAA